MATSQFKTESPYNDTRKPPSADYKYNKFHDMVMNDGLDAPPIHVALIGLGRIGKMHLQNILANPRLRLSYIVISPRKKCEEVVQKWNLTKMTKVLHSTDVHIVYSDPSVESCVIATSTRSHVEYIISSLKAGKSVFCEKPIAETESETEKCYAAASEAGKPLFCAFNRRFDPSFSAVQRQVRNGTVGHVQIIQTVGGGPQIYFLENCFIAFMDIKGHGASKTFYEFYFI